jgi:hypothetical protein
MHNKGCTKLFAMSLGIVIRNVLVDFWGIYELLSVRTHGV